MKAILRDFWARPFAHRGYHDAADGRVENSLSAIRAAVEAGFGVEFDVLISSDGEAMVFHDYRLDRLTGETGRVDERDAETLGAIRLLDSKDTIPTLAAVVEAIGDDTPVLLELKDQAGECGISDGVLAARVCEVLRTVRQLDRYGVISYNPFSIGCVRDLLPEVYRGVVSYDFRHPNHSHIDASHRQDLADLRYFDEVGAHFLSYGARSLPTPHTEALRARGVPIVCWTVRSEQEAETALRYSDQITFEGYAPA